MLVQPDSQTKELPIYESLTPMRCVLAKKFSPQNWEVIKLMEQHKEERKKDPFYLGKPIYSKDVLYILTREWVLHSTHQGSQNYCKVQCAPSVVECKDVRTHTLLSMGHTCPSPTLSHKSDLHIPTASGAKTEASAIQFN